MMMRMMVYWIEENRKTQTSGEVATNSESRRGSPDGFHLCSVCQLTGPPLCQVLTRWNRHCYQLAIEVEGRLCLHKLLCNSFIHRIMTKPLHISQVTDAYLTQTKS